MTPDVKAGKDLLKSLEEAMVTEAKNLNNTAILNEFYRQGRQGSSYEIFGLGWGWVSGSDWVRYKVSVKTIHVIGK